MLAFALPAVAQEGMVTGTVKDAKGKPVEGAKITIELVEQRPRKSRLKTDKNGEYIQVGLSAGGPYTLTAEKEGVGTATRMRDGAQPARNPYDIVLAPGAMPAETRLPMR